MTRESSLQDVLEPTPDPRWLLTADGFDPLRENVLESRFTVSNGFLGVRAARAMSRGERWVRPPRTFVAGLFDISSPEQPIPGLMTGADWLKVRMKVFGAPLIPHPADILSYRATLDMRRGVLLTGGRVRKLGGPVRVRTLRLVSLSERALGFQLAAPFIVFGFALYAALGILARLMPQLQVFFVAMPVNILAGLLLLMLVIGTMMTVFLNFYRDQMGTFIGT